MKEAFAIVAVLLAIVGNVPYVRGMLRGVVRPHPYSWFVWSIVSGTVLVGMWVKGAGWGALPVLVSELFTIGIFLFSLKYGFKGATKSDTVFLLIALLGLVPWFLTQDPTISIAVAVGIDLIAFGPTLRKTWAVSSTEAPILYSSNVLRHVLMLLSLANYNVATTLHSIAMITANALMTATIFLRRNRGY